MLLLLYFENDEIDETRIVSKSVVFNIFRLILHFMFWLETYERWEV